MSKAVMRSLPPQVCERIANGKQTMLVVKKQPKLETPYKEYIYCTSSDVHSGLVVGNGSARLIKCCNYKTGIVEGGEIGNGKVIGEYIVDKTISPIMAYCSNPNESTASEIIYGLNDKQIIEYLGNGKEGHGLHISNLKLYDKPKGLGEFFKPCGNCDKKGTSRCTEEISYCRATTLKRPPRSCFYVEEM